MKVPIVSVLDKTRSSSFFAFVVLLATCVGLIAPTPLRAAAQQKTVKAKEKTLKEILAEVRRERNPPKVVADPNANQSLGYIFRWGLPDLETDDGQSLTLAPQQLLEGRANPFDGSRAFGGVDPFAGQTRFSLPAALNRPNALGQSQSLQRVNPFGGSQRLSSGSPFGNASTFGRSRPSASSETFGSRSRFGSSAGRFGSARRGTGRTFGTSQPFGTSNRGISARRFGESTQANRFGESFGTGQSSRFSGNPGLGYKGLSNRSNAFNRPSPFNSTGASNGGASRLAPTVFGGR